MNRTLRQILDTTIPMTWIVVGLFVFLLLLWAWFSSNLVIRQHRYPIQIIPAAFGVSYETVTFAAEDGIELTGWFVPARTSSETTLVLCHGWGANRSDILPHTVFLNTRGGYNLFYFDFRNHGESGGQHSSLGVFEARDLRGALSYIRKNKAAQSRRIGLYGLSMGGAVALTVAAHDPGIAAVVAESPFSSYREAVIRFARLFYGVPRVPFVEFTLWAVKMRLGVDSEETSPVYHIDKIAPRPVFLIQGDQDTRMPPSEGERLYEKAKEPKTLWTIPGADHGEAASIAGSEYEQRILGFFQNAFSSDF